MIANDFRMVTQAVRCHFMQDVQIPMALADSLRHLG
jgi:hypothetical protein